MCTYKARSDHSGEDFYLQGLAQVYDLYSLIVENYSQQAGNSFVRPIALPTSTYCQPLSFKHEMRCLR